MKNYFSFTAVFFALVLGFLSEKAQSKGTSMSRTCAGRIQVCENNEAKKCAVREFSFYAYQYVDGSAETHSFELKGALAQKDPLVSLGRSDHWMIYQGEKFFYAVPWESKHEIFAFPRWDVKDAFRPGAPGKEPWRKLCTKRRPFEVGN